MAAAILLARDIATYEHRPLAVELAGKRRGQMRHGDPQRTPPGLLDDVISAWLSEMYGRSPATGGVYCSAMRTYLPWCAEHEVDPFQITRRQASRFVGWLSEEPSPATGQLRSASNVAPVLSACSSLIEYVTTDELRPEPARNPFRMVTRPKVPVLPRSSPTLSLSDINRLLLAAHRDHVLGGVLGKLVVALLGLTGLRPGDVCRLNVLGVSDDGEGGYRMQTALKGGEGSVRWLGPRIAADLYAYLNRVRVRPDEELVGTDPYGTDPLLVHPRLRRRLNTDDMRALVKRSAVRAGLPVGPKLCLRHFRPNWNTLARMAGAELEDRQKGLGHARAATTQLHDRTVWTRERDPAIRIADANDGYPAEDLTRPIEWAKTHAPAGEFECDCTPQWANMRIWLGPVGVPEYGHAVVTEEWEPGVAALGSPTCPVCQGRYLGPFQVRHIPDDPDGRLLEQCREALAERALYPEAVERREERRRGDQP